MCVYSEYEGGMAVSPNNPMDASHPSIWEERRGEEGWVPLDAWGINGFLRGTGLATRLTRSRRSLLRLRCGGLLPGPVPASHLWGTQKGDSPSRPPHLPPGGGGQEGQRHQPQELRASWDFPGPAVFFLNNFGHR